MYTRVIVEDWPLCVCIRVTYQQLFPILVENDCFQGLLDVNSLMQVIQVPERTKTNHIEHASPKLVENHPDVCHPTSRPASPIEVHDVFVDTFKCQVET